MSNSSHNESSNLFETVAAAASGLPAARNSGSDISSLASSTELAPMPNISNPEVDIARHPSGIVPVLQ